MAEEAYKRCSLSSMWPENILNPFTIALPFVQQEHYSPAVLKLHINDKLLYFHFSTHNAMGVVWNSQNEEEEKTSSLRLNKFAAHEKLGFE